MAGSYFVFNFCSLIQKYTQTNRDISLNQEGSLEDVRIRKSWPPNHRAELDKFELHFLSLNSSSAAVHQSELEAQNGNTQTGWAENPPLECCKIMLLTKDGMELGLLSWPTKKTKQKKPLNFSFQNPIFQIQLSHGSIHPSIYIFRAPCCSTSSWQVFYLFKEDQTMNPLG